MFNRDMDTHKKKTIGNPTQHRNLTETHIHTHTQFNLSARSQHCPHVHQWPGVDFTLTDTPRTNHHPSQIKSNANITTLPQQLPYNQTHSQTHTQLYLLYTHKPTPETQWLLMIAHAKRNNKKRTLSIIQVNDRHAIFICRGNAGAVDRTGVIFAVVFYATTPFVIGG